MPVIISFAKSDGIERRCDAKCYDAKAPECDCICGGANHGKGLAVAIENAQVIARDILSDGKFREILYQLPLPTEVKP